MPAVSVAYSADAAASSVACELSSVGVSFRGGVRETLEVTLSDPSVRRWLASLGLGIAVCFSS